MSIPYDNLRHVTARQFVNALEKKGFVMVRSKGSHRVYRDAFHRRVVVAYHRGGDTFPIGLFKKMIEVEAGWTMDDLLELKLLKKS